MSDLDNAINSINASAAKAENTAGFLDDMSTFDDQSSVTNPNNGQTVASIPKQVKDRTDELFTAAESDINQAVSDAAQSATDAQDAADSIGRYQGLWPDTGGIADKGDTYQTQASGVPTGQYFTALQNTTVDPVGDDVNWRVVVSNQSLGLITNYQAASVAQAKSMDVPVGSVISTSSYRHLSSTDTFGAATYIKVSLSEFVGTPDEYGDHSCPDGTVLKLSRDNPEVSQFGAWENDETKDSTEFFEAARAAAGPEQLVEFAYSNYYVNIESWDKSIKANGSTLYRFDDSTPFAINFSSFAPNWNFKSVFNLNVEGVDKSHVCVGIGYQTDAVAGRWAFFDCIFLRGEYNIRKYSGNIGNRFINCRLGGGVYNFWADDSETIPMHTGADYWEGCHIDGFTVVGVYYKDSTLGYGQHTFNNVIFEEGPGNGLVMRNSKPEGDVTYVPPRLESVWFEQVATGPDVELDDLGVLPPVNFWSIGIKGMSLDNGILNNSRIQNSNLSLNNMRLDNASSGVSGDVDIDQDSVVTCENVIVDTPGSIRCEVGSFQHTSRLGSIAAGGFSCFAPTRNSISASGFGVIRNTNSYNTNSAISVPGSVSVLSVPKTPGFLGDAVHEITIASGQTVFVGGNSNVPSGDLYIASINIRATTGTQDDINSRWAGDSGSLGSLLIDRHSPDLWRCSLVTGKSQGQVNTRAVFTNTSPSDVTIEVADVQVVSFTDERSLISYINGRMFTNA